MTYLAIFSSIKRFRQKSLTRKLLILSSPHTILTLSHVSVLGVCKVKHNKIAIATQLATLLAALLLAPVQ